MNTIYLFFFNLCKHLKIIFHTKQAKFDERKTNTHAVHDDQTYGWFRLGYTRQHKITSIVFFYNNIVR